MIYFLGDVHGQFDHILPALARDRLPAGEPRAVIFLGDIEAQRPFEEEITPLLDADIEVWFIHGNHDTDSRQNWAHLLPSWHRNLDGRVVTIQGLKIAGLGGIFRGAIWYGDADRRYESFADFERSRCFKPNHHLDGQLLKHSSSIWPSVYDQLACERADILVTHEAPSCHPHGFEALDELARAMQVKALFHGHHHDSLNYRDCEEQLGFQAYGVGFRGITDHHGGRVI